MAEGNTCRCITLRLEMRYATRMTAMHDFTQQSTAEGDICRCVTLRIEMRYATRVTAIYRIAKQFVSEVDTCTCVMLLIEMRHVTCTCVMLRIAMRHVECVTAICYTENGSTSRTKLLSTSEEKSTRTHTHANECRDTHERAKSHLHAYS